MSKRNKNLLIILLIALAILAFFWFTRENPGTLAPGETPSTNFWSQFNPFKPSTPTPGAPAEPGDTTDIPTAGEDQELRLRRVSNMPVAGYVVYQKERYKEINPTPALPLSGEGVPPAKGGTGGQIPTPPQTEFAPALRYVARATGNIYQTFVDIIDERKFTGTLVPKVYEAYFGNKGEAVIMRRLKVDERTIETFAGALPKELLGGDTSENNEVGGTFLPDNITDMSVSSDGSKIFYLYNQGESVIGTTSGVLGDKKVQVFDSPFSEWLTSWPSAKMIVLTTKPSGNIPGYLYALNPDTKSLAKILGGINGLTAIGSPSGKLILYGDSSLSLNIYDLETRSSLALGARTLPEKCVWNKGSTAIYCAVPKSAPGAFYPDSWYRGEVSFNDDIWKIDVETGSGAIILEPTRAPGGVVVDGIKPSLDENESYLFFVNKSDSYLWEIKL